MSKIGPYEIQQKLGEGAMGQVYLGWHPILKQHHAIKVLSGQFNRADLARFQRELEIVAGIKHPNVIAIHSAGLQGTRQPYYAMDFVRGEDLESRIKAGRFEEEAAASIIRKLALALAEFHDQGVLHRDIKPANILLAGGKEPKLADFGLAKNDSGQQLTRTGEIVGTPIYMSPEQATGQSLDSRSDLYSLGAIFFEMLAGHPMVMGKTTPEVLHKVARGEVYSLDAFRPEASSHLNAIIKKATHFQREKRYNNARELAADLEAFLKGDSPAPVLSDNRRFRRLLWLPIAVLVISGSGIGAVFWFQKQEQKIADDKQTQAFAKQVQRLTPKSDNDEILRLYQLKDRFWNADDSSKSARRVFGTLELWRARVALRNHDALTAAKNVEDAQKLLPRSDPHLLGIQAGLAIESQEYSLEKAEKFINKALSKRKDDGEFHAWAARIYFSQGKTHVAASEADLARLGGFPVPTVDALLELKKKNYARVIRYIEEEKASVTKEDYEEALSGAAKRATADRRFEAATEYVSKLQALNPKHITLRKVSQKLLRASEGQLSALNDVIKKNPRDKLDEIAEMGSRLEKSFRLARMANPTMDIGQKVRKGIESASIILTKMVETYMQAEKGGPERQVKILKILDIYIAIDPSNAFAQACYISASGYLQRGAFSEPELNKRLKRFNSLKRVDVESRILAIEGASRLYLRLGEYQLCKSLLLKELAKPYAKEQAHRIGWYYVNLASCYEKEKDYEQQLKTLNKAIDSGIGATYVYRDRCKIHLRKNDFETALTDMYEVFNSTSSTSPPRAQVLIAMIELCGIVQAKEIRPRLYQETDKIAELSLGQRVRYARSLFLVGERKKALGILSLVKKDVEAQKDIPQRKAILARLKSIIEQETKRSSTSTANREYLLSIATVLSKGLAARNRREEESQ